MDSSSTTEEKKAYTYSPVQKLGSIHRETATGAGPTNDGPNSS
jgi:hypothetical protein